MWDTRFLGCTAMLGAGEFSGTLTTGSYWLVRALGDGDGRVHEARHERVAGRFALKLFGDVDPRAFERGAQQAAALRHPGIVKVVDYGRTSGRAFVVMEWVEGHSLAALLAQGGAMPAERVARLVDSVALGLQAAHRQGLAHGHLDPGRVFVLAPGGDGDETPGAERTKIVGFGLGDDLAPGPQITEETPYMAPEQLAGEARPLADQFALAAIVYELLAGVPPSTDADDGQRPRSLREYASDLNVIVDDVVQRALLPDPGARWADVYTFSKRLREAVDAGGELEEKTRLAPLPLTVTRSATFSAPILAVPTPIAVPVIASVDVDLRTPAPRRFESPISGGPSMNHQYPPGNQVRPSRAPAPVRPYPIRPTPTFSFTDEPAPGPMWKPPRRRSGGGLGLFVLVLVAGAGGYFTVQTRAWQDVGPLVARAKALASSLKTLAPAASRETAPAPPTAPTAGSLAADGTPTTAPAGEATAAPTAAATTAAAAKTTAAPAALHPEVVQIAPTSAPKTPAPRASKPSASTVAASTRKEAVTKPTAPAAHRAAHAHVGHARAPAFDEAAAEEALLNGP
jgi:serine/threonine protein kinase